MQAQKPLPFSPPPAILGTRVLTPSPTQKVSQTLPLPVPRSE